MENLGWYKMQRKIIESPIFDNSDALKMWVWMLAKASHKKHELIVGRQKVTLNIGEFVFGRRAASIELKMSESKVYRLVKFIEKLDMIEVKPNNKFSVINIVNWEFYQCSDSISRTTTEQQVNNKRTTTEQQVNTNNNEKKEKKVKKEKNNIEDAGASCEAKQPKRQLYYPLDAKLNQAMIDFVEYRKKIKAPMTDRAVDLMIGKLDSMTADNNEKIAILEQSIVNGWKGVFPLRNENTKKVEDNEFLKITERLANEEGVDLF